MWLKIGICAVGLGSKTQRQILKNIFRGKSHYMTEYDIKQEVHQLFHFPLRQ
jgi:hypothetical protein